MSSFVPMDPHPLSLFSGDNCGQQYIFHECSFLAAEQPHICRQGVGEGNEGHHIQGERTWSLWPWPFDLLPAMCIPPSSYSFLLLSAAPARWALSSHPGFIEMATVLITNSKNNY